MARRFVLVEILDRDVRYLLSELRLIFNGRAANTPVHVTIRGPYPTAVSKALIESLEERLRKDVLLVAGVGAFKSSSRSVVFLRVASKRLRGGMVETRLFRQNSWVPAAYHTIRRI